MNPILEQPLAGSMLNGENSAPPAGVELYGHFLEVSVLQNYSGVCHLDLIQSFNMVAYGANTEPLPTEGLYWQITSVFKSAACENIRLVLSTIIVSLLVIFDFAGIANGYMALNVHPVLAFILLVSASMRSIPPIELLSPPTHISDSNILSISLLCSDALVRCVDPPGVH